MVFVGNLKVVRTWRGGGCQLSRLTLNCRLSSRVFVLKELSVFPVIGRAIYKDQLLLCYPEVDAYNHQIAFSSYFPDKSYPD